MNNKNKHTNSQVIIYLFNKIHLLPLFQKKKDLYEITDSDFTNHKCQK